jgi:carboxyl-terminal processing protease
MLPASNRGAGTNIGFPDVCNTPVGPATAPVPYPNLGLHAQAAPFSTIVRTSMMNALNLGSRIPMTMGDEAGAAHPTIKGAGSFTAGNPIVYIEKLPAVTLTSPTTGNNMNNALGAVLVPAVTNVFFTCAAAPVREAEVAVESLGEALAMDQSAPAVGRPRRIGGIGYVAIRRFSFDAPGLAARAIEALRERGCGRIVIDLRGNPGGELSACLRLLGALLPCGDALLVERDAEGDETVHRARGGAMVAGDLPITLVVGERTASAAELFAAVLQAQGRATVAGAPTYGKPTAQALAVSPDGRGRYGTVATFALPSGEPITRVVPDALR